MYSSRGREFARRIAVLAGILVVGGCASGGHKAPPIPLPEEARAEMDRWNAVGITDANAPDYVEAAYNLTDRQCTAFFTAVNEARNNIDFGKDTLVTAASAAGVISGIAGAGLTTLTTLLGATGAIPSVANTYKAVYLLGSVPVESRALIKDGMDSFRANNPSRTATRLTAEHMVQAYADWCTLPTIQWAVANALKSVKAQDSTKIPQAADASTRSLPHAPGVVLGAPPRSAAPLASMGGKELVPR
jgi:hypothetical protein